MLYQCIVTFKLCCKHPQTGGKFPLIYMRACAIIIMVAYSNQYRTAVSVHTGNSVHAEWVMSHKLAAQNITTKYVRSGVECVALCRFRDECL